MGAYRRLAGSSGSTALSAFLRHLLLLCQGYLPLSIPADTFLKLRVGLFWFLILGLNADKRKELLRRQGRLMTFLARGGIAMAARFFTCEPFHQCRAALTRPART